MLTLPANAQSIKANDLVGDWLAGEGKAIVRIGYNGKAYEGNVVWLKEPKNPDGSIKLDKNNPDDALKSKPIIGSHMLKGFTYAGDGEWENGTIYDARNGKTYSCVITMESINKLKVRGYIGMPMFGKTQDWTRTQVPK